MTADPRTQDPLDHKLRQLMGEMAASAPQLAASPTLRFREPTRPHNDTWMYMLGIAATLLVLAGIGAYALRSDSPDVVVAAGETIVEPVTSASAEAPEPTSVERAPIAPQSAVCPPGFRIERDTDDDGVIDTCYPGDDLADAADARERWQQASIGDYEFRYAAMTTTGMSTVVDVVVEDGKPALVQVVRAGSEPTVAWSVDDLFDIIENADDVREASFDPVLGYPTLLSVDPDRSVVDDEIRVMVSELFSIADIEAAAAELEPWFPEPTELPAALVELIDRMGAARYDDLEIGKSYRLHAGSGVEVYVFRNGHDLCTVAVTLAPPEANGGYGSMGAECQSEPAFARDGNWTAQTNDFGEQSYLLVVPPTRYVNEPWDIVIDAGRGYTIDKTDRSALVLFDGQGGADTVTATVTCECGELNYSFELTASN